MSSDTERSYMVTSSGRMHNHLLSSAVFDLHVVHVEHVNVRASEGLPCGRGCV